MGVLKTNDPLMPYALSYVSKKLTCCRIALNLVLLILLAYWLAKLKVHHIMDLDPDKTGTKVTVTILTLVYSVLFFFFIFLIFEYNNIMTMDYLKEN